jgi:hypothetical protein
MNSRVEYVFTAFDLATELLTWESVIPEGYIPGVWAAAGITLPPREMMACWPLTPDQARPVALILGREVDGSEAHYFVEALQPET